ncbi:MAG: CPXCG motif-containing cysteine-rich protein [Elusimicrobia bacterium]|nr:CPXCG motif-containing cysteine-rich protein [Elusimicrobiota bacterium]
MKARPRRHARRKPALGRRAAHKRPSSRGPALAEETLPRAQEWAQVPCPYCGEQLEVLVGADEDGHTRFEDCSVCCRTVSLHVTWDEGETQVEAVRD